MDRSHNECRMILHKAGFEIPKLVYKSLRQKEYLGLFMCRKLFVYNKGLFVKKGSQETWQLSII